MHIVPWTSHASLLILCILLIPTSTSGQVKRDSSLSRTENEKNADLAWVGVSPANKEFRVWMPESPQTETERLVIDHQRVVLTYYGVNQEGAEYAVLSVSGLEDKKADLAHMLMLNLYSKSIPKSLIGSSDKNEASIAATFQRKILLNGYPGQEYKIKARYTTGIWRFFSVGKRYYVIAASTGRNENMVSRFLESFALGATTSATNTNPVPAQLDAEAQHPPRSLSRGTWLIILQTFAKADRSKASQRLDLLRTSGYDVRLLVTDHYPNLKKGFLVAAIGPQSKGAAENVLNKVRSVAPGSYLKSGW